MEALPSDVVAQDSQLASEQEPMISAGNDVIESKNNAVENRKMTKDVLNADETDQLVSSTDDSNNHKRDQINLNKTDENKNTVSKPSTNTAAKRDLSPTKVTFDSEAVDKKQLLDQGEFRKRQEASKTSGKARYSDHHNVYFIGRK